MTYKPLLANHQPDCRYQGDELSRAVNRFRSEAAFLSENIQHEIASAKRIGTAERYGQARTWIIQAQKARRKALATAEEYQHLVNEQTISRRLFAIAA